MNRRFALLLTMLLAVPAAFAHHVEFSTLRAGSFAQLLASRQGKPFLLVLWSVACEPCRPQFQLLAELRQAHPDMPLVLVATDGTPLQRVAGQALLQAGLEHESNWIFAQRQSAPIRLEIDPDWDGSLPRSYFYDAGHQRDVIAGSLDRVGVEAWLARVTPPR